MQATGKNEDAVNLLQEIVREHPLEGRALIQLGILSWSSKNSALAIIQFERAAKIKEFENQALIQHARLLVSERRYQEASDLLERALEIKPEKRVEKYNSAIQNLLLSSRKQR